MQREIELWLEQHEFTAGEWPRAASQNTTRGKCLKCMDRNREQKQCSQCREFKGKEHYAPERQWSKETSETRKCVECLKQSTTRLCRLCKGKCGLWLEQHEFGPGEWPRAARQNTTRGKCLKCMDRHQEQKQCSQCREFKGKEHYAPERQWAKETSKTRQCVECLKQSTKRACKGKCGLWLEQQEFAPGEWHRAAWTNTARGKCTKCMERNQGKKQCSQCREYKGREQYAPERQWIEETAKTRRCVECLRRAETEVSKTGQRPWRCACCQKEKGKNEFTRWLKGKEQKAKRKTGQCNSCFPSTQSEKLDGVKRAKRK